jgi:hypothetical protein
MTMAGTSPADRSIRYKPGGPTLVRAHNSPAFVRGIMGPIGSGKSTTCAMEILRRSTLQRRSPDGKRRTRWAIIRNSYPELKTTTLKTWGEWCPPQYGRLTMDSPIRHHVQTADLDMEVFFMALDREDDVRKLLSLELTGAWVNEAREVPKAIIDALTGRVGRYPSKAMGGADWSGILMDTNPPDDQSWWYRLAEEETPHGWEFFKQPAGDSPEAENIDNLPNGYYARLIPGKDEDWIKVYVKGEYGYLIQGKPVYPMYRDRVHAATEELQMVPVLPILVGADFGLTPAAVFGQRLVDGRWRVVDELVTDNCGVTRFSELVLSHAAAKWPGHAIVLPAGFGDDNRKSPNHPRYNEAIKGFGDPAGNCRSETDEKTALELMRLGTGWDWKAAPANDFTTRREIVVAALNRLVDGNPGLIVSPTCKFIRKGFSSGYHYKFIRTANGSTPQVHDTPAKNEYSHPHDALQYLMLGGGEANVILQRTKRRASRQPRQAKDVDYKIFG